MGEATSALGDAADMFTDSTTLGGFEVGGGQAFATPPIPPGAAQDVVDGSDTMGNVPLYPMMMFTE